MCLKRGIPVYQFNRENGYEPSNFGVSSFLTNPYLIYTLVIERSYGKSPLFASPILASNTLDTLSATLLLLNSTFALTTSFSLRTISSPFRRGAPRAHWPEIALAESAHCLQHLRQNPPVLGHFLHLFYSHFTIVELKTFSAASMKQWYNTTRFVHLLFPLAEHQEQWKLLIPKMK